MKPREFWITPEIAYRAGHILTKDEYEKEPFHDPKWMFVRQVPSNYESVIHSMIKALENSCICRTNPFLVIAGLSKDNRPRTCPACKGIDALIEILDID